MIFCANVHLHQFEMDNPDYGHYIHTVISQLEQVAPALNDIIQQLESQGQTLTLDANDSILKGPSIRQRLSLYIEGGSLPGPIKGEDKTRGEILDMIYFEALGSI